MFRTMALGAGSIASFIGTHINIIVSLIDHFLYFAFLLLCGVYKLHLLNLGVIAYS